MGRHAIARCIVRAIKAQDTDRPKHSLLRRILSWFAALFALWKVPLQRNKDETFSPLREFWSAPEDVFVRSFTSSDGDETSALEQMGTMGYSGSVHLPPLAFHSLLMTLDFLPNKRQHLHCQISPAVL